MNNVIINPTHLGLCVLLGFGKVSWKLSEISGLSFMGFRQIGFKIGERYNFRLLKFPHGQQVEIASPKNLTGQVIGIAVFCQSEEEVVFGIAAYVDDGVNINEKGDGT